MINKQVLTGMQLPKNLDIEDALTRAVWKFNFRPDSYVHASWLKSMPEGDVVARLRARGVGENRLSQYMLTRLGIADSVFFDFRSPLAQIGLWGGEDITRLIEYLGAVLYRNLARRVIARDDIIRLRHAIGEDLYAFMQQRAPALTHNITRLPAFPEKMGLKKRMILAGILCLRAAFSRFPDAFWKRLMFKLERDWYGLWKQYATLGKELESVSGECAVLVTKVVIEIKMGMGRDGKILFN
jgi:hypothetical protein